MTGPLWTSPKRANHRESPVASQANPARSAPPCTLIFSPDHGRGDAPEEWKSHGQKIPDSKYIWMSFLGPDTPALGERKNVAPVTQNQIAATLARLLGLDYRADVPQAGEPIPSVYGVR